MNEPSRWSLPIVAAVIALAAAWPRAAVADNRGCDGISDVFGHDATSCGKGGHCCDAHDKCYADAAPQYGSACSAASWPCAPGVCAGVGLANRVAGMVCNAARNVACSPADRSFHCAGCNLKAAGCFGGAYSGLGDAGPAKCCSRGDCGEPQCPGVAADGSCPDDPPDEPDPPPSDPPCLMCNPPPGGPGGGLGGSAITSASPEEIYGPAPNGQVVSRTIPWSYQIDFWNSPTALAPVQELIVVDYLPATLDYATLDFGSVEYGDRFIPVPAGVTTFTTRDLPPNDGCIITGHPDGQLAVDVNLSFNPVSGRIELRLKVIDTALDDWPYDPYAGILPPPDIVTCGRGSITYTVRPRADTPDYTIISNKASVIFDTNAPNDTNTVWNPVGP